MARPARFKICEHCGCKFQITHSCNRWCSRECKWQSTYPKPGEKFHRLTIIGFSHRGKRNAGYMKVRCDCGVEFAAPQTEIKNGGIKSCGCLRSETSRANGQQTRRHGMSGTAEWKTFHSAKKRCRNPNDTRFDDYGGRGIEFRFESFEQFYAELGPRPSPAHSIDRIDNDGHYEPGNVRWATNEEQRLNKRPRRWQKKPL